MKINRLFEIIYTLLQKERITAEELAERFEVSTRTIYRDIDVLSSVGIPVYMMKGRGGGIALLPNYILDKTILTEDERKSATENNSELAEIQENIKTLSTQLGLTDVTGKGVIIKVDDAMVQSTFDPNSTIVHDADLISIVNELKNAGAEAISINDQRIVSNTVIECIGAVIKINGQRVGAPFTIKAIGMPELLKNTYRNGGYLKVLEGDRIQVDFKTSDNITIPKYTGTYKFEYAQTINNK